MVHSIAIDLLLALCVLLCVLCAVGVVTMRDAYQRLHFTTPVAAVVTLLLCVAVWMNDPDWQARIKCVVVTLMLLSTNSIVCHATARALRIREQGALGLDPAEPVAGAGQT